MPGRLVRYAYFVLIFSIAFEAADIGFATGSFTISKLFGYVFFAATLLQPRVCFKRPCSGVWCFIVYFGIFAAFGLWPSLFAIPEQQDSQALIRVQLFTFSQMLVFIWISSNLMWHEQTARGSLWALAISCTLIALRQVLGFSEVSDLQETQGRFSDFGTNPNTLAALLSLGSLSLVGLAYGWEKANFRARIFLWIFFGILAIAIVRTGSRGALLGLLLGFLFFVLKGRRFATKLKISLILLLAIGFLGWVSYSIEAVRTRWESTFFEGSLASREMIIPIAWEMYLEKPLIGWGPVEHSFELGRRLRATRTDPHNLYLSILVGAGLLGGIPFFLGLWLCWIAAWRARKTIHGVLPLAMLVCLLALNASGTWHNQKFFWFVLAYALATKFSPDHLWHRQRVKPLVRITMPVGPKVPVLPSSD